MSVTRLKDKKKKKALMDKFMSGGWQINDTKNKGLVVNADNADGPTIYICDIDSSMLYVVATIKDAVKILEKESTNTKFKFDVICDAVNSLIADLSSSKLKLDGKISNTFATGAVMYLAGTQSYAYMKNIGKANGQFIVLRYRDYANGDYLLRPNPVLSDKMLTPQEVEYQVRMILGNDKLKHPERFKRADIIPFKIKSTCKI